MSTAKPTMEARTGVAEVSSIEWDRASAPSRPMPTPASAVIKGDTGARREPRARISTRATNAMPSASEPPSGAVCGLRDSDVRARAPTLSAWAAAISTMWSMVPDGMSSIGSANCDCMIATEPFADTTMSGTGVPPTTRGCALPLPAVGAAEPGGGLILCSAVAGSARCTTMSSAWMRVAASRSAFAESPSSRRPSSPATRTIDPCPPASCGNSPRNSSSTAWLFVPSIVIAEMIVPPPAPITRPTTAASRIAQEAINSYGR